MKKVILPRAAFCFPSPQEGAQAEIKILSNSLIFHFTTLRQKVHKFGSCFSSNVSVIDILNVDQAYSPRSDWPSSTTTNF
jgi:hypothetical protein